MTMMLPEENLIIPKDVLANAAMHSMLSNITFEDDMSLDDDDESSYWTTSIGESSASQKRVSEVINRSQDILNILENIDTAVEESRPERKKLGKLYSSMPIIQPIRKRSIHKESVGQMRNATFSRPSPPSAKRPSPFDAILKSDPARAPVVRSSENHQFPQDFQRSNREETFRRAHSILKHKANKLGSSSSNRLTSKWDTSPTPPASNRSSSIRSSVNQSMPILKPVRKKSSEGLAPMRNAAFGLTSKPLAASRFDAIAQGSSSKKPQQQQQVSGFWSLSNQGSSATLRRAQSMFGNSSRPGAIPEFDSVHGSSPAASGAPSLNDKWESSLPSSKPLAAAATLRRAQSVLGTSSRPGAIPEFASVLGSSAPSINDKWGSSSSSKRLKAASGAIPEFASVLGCSVPSGTGAAPSLNDKWESSPPSSSRSTLGRSRRMNQSMPILKPVRKKSSEGLDAMRNATFTTSGPLPTNTSLKTAASASRFDSILRGNNTRTQRASQYVKKNPSPFDAIVQRSEQRIQQLGFQKSSKAPLRFGAIVQSQLQSHHQLLMSPTQSSRGQLDITPKTSNARMTLSSSMKRAQSVSHHVSANYLGAKWEASSPTGKTKNAVFQSVLPKPVRRGSINDSKPLNKQLQGNSTKKKPSPFDVIVRSTMQLGVQSHQEDEEPQAPPQDDTPKSSNTKKLRLPNSLNTKLQQSSRLRRAQSVPAHVADNKWESSPTSANNKNAVFDLNKPVRKGSIDLMPLDEKKKVFQTLAQRQAKKHQQLCPLSKSRTTAFGGTSLLETSALEILLSKPMPRLSPTRSQRNMMLPRNQ